VGEGGVRGRYLGLRRTLADAWPDLRELALLEAAARSAEH
jgi:hypothetical protein